MIPGWCKECRETPPAFELGAAVRVEHDPPTSKEEDTLRWLLSKSLPLAVRDDFRVGTQPLSTSMS